VTGDHVTTDRAGGVTDAELRGELRCDLVLAPLRVATEDLKHPVLRAKADAFLSPSANRELLPQSGVLDREPGAGKESGPDKGEQSVIRVEFRHTTGMI